MIFGEQLNGLDFYKSEKGVPKIPLSAPFCKILKQN